MLCGCLFVVTANAQMMLENYEEYLSDADLQAVWFPQSATLSLSPNVAYRSTGTNSMRVDILARQCLADHRAHHTGTPGSDRDLA
jgi:hypothetical protein